jgi:hypothetical protein
MTVHAARSSVEETSRQARLAMFAIGAVGCLEALGGVFNDLDVPGILCQLLCYGAWIVAAVLYCRWLYCAYKDAALLQGASLRFTPREAVVSFFLPFVALYRPYQVLVHLHAVSDPRSIAIPPETGAGVGGWEKLFPAAAWWALWLLAPWVTGILDNVSLLVQLMTLDTLTDPSALLRSQETAGDWLMRGLAALIHIALAALAVEVIRSIAARQRERLRRVEVADGARGSSPRSSLAIYSGTNCR